MVATLVPDYMTIPPHHFSVVIFVEFLLGAETKKKFTKCVQCKSSSLHKERLYSLSEKLYLEFDVGRTELWFTQAVITLLQYNIILV